MPEQAQRTSMGDKTDPTAAPPAVSLRQRLATWLTQRLNRGVLAALLTVSLIMNAAVLGYTRLHKSATVTVASSPEVELGGFEFRGPDSAVSAVDGAKFSLYVSLLDGVDKAARAHLLANRHRVQQTVEELLRTAHGADFEDPNLIGLKRQVQEQINGALGMRAVSEVIITNLVLERGQQPADSKSQTAGPSSSPKAPPG